MRATGIYICIYSENMCYDAIYNKESSKPNVLATLPRRKATWLAAATHSLSLSLSTSLYHCKLPNRRCVKYTTFVYTNARACTKYTHTHTMLKEIWTNALPTCLRSRPACRLAQPLTAKEEEDCHHRHAPQADCGYRRFLAE